MNITLTLVITVAVLIVMLIAIVKIAVKERKEKLTYKSEAERKSNTIEYLYKHTTELEQINADKDKLQEELLNAETDEEVLDIVHAVVNANNKRVREQAKK